MLHALSVQIEIYRSEKVGSPPVGAVRAIESSLVRGAGTIGLSGVGQMPLSGHVGRVAGGFQRFGKCGQVRVEATTGRTICERALWVKAGQEASARGPAHVVNVVVREAKAVRRELVEIGRLDFSAIAAEIGEAHVVGDDEHDVWFALSRRRREAKKAG